MTLPKTSKDLLMFTPSLNVAPSAPVFFARSDPARSTKWNLAVIYSSGFSSYLSSPSMIALCSIAIVKMACDLDELLFMSVEAVVLLLVPLSRQAAISSAL